MYLLLLVVLMIFGAMCQDISQFSKEDALCDLEERINKGCSKQIGLVRSYLECAYKCALKTSCIGASMDENGLCFHHEECPTVSSCSKQESNHRYLTKNRGNETLDVSQQKCLCGDAPSGDGCKQCLSDCGDLQAAGYAPGSRHYLYLDPDQNGQSFPAVCRYVGNWFAFFVFSNTGKYSFNKTWTDYINGWFHDQENFWIGFRSWHRMSNVGYNKLHIVLKLARRPRAEISRYHANFVLSSEAAGYTFQFKNSSPRRFGTKPSNVSFGDCLGSLKNVPFSTWDADKDQNGTNNCAADAGSGWWFNNGCDNPCNVLGFQPQHSATLSKRQIWSLIGLDMEEVSDMDGVSSEELQFSMYIKT